MKNSKNDRSDASLHVDHLGDAHGSRSGTRSPIRGLSLKNVYNSTGSGSHIGDKNTQSIVYYSKKYQIDLILTTNFFITSVMADGSVFLKV